MDPLFSIGLEPLFCRLASGDIPDSGEWCAATSRIVNELGLSVDTETELTNSLCRSMDAVADAALITRNIEADFRHALERAKG